MANTYDFLKPVLGDELFSQFEEKMSGAQGITLVNATDGSYIPKAKLDEERSTSKGYKGQIDELKTRLEELQKVAEGNETLKEQIAQLQKAAEGNEALKGQIAQLQKAAEGNETLKGQIAQLQKDIARKDAAMAKQRMDYTIKDAVRSNKAKNADLVMKMIDTSKITEKDGVIYGLKEQIDALKETDAYLFESDGGSAGGVDPHNDPQGGSVPPNVLVNNLIRSAAGR